LKAPLVTKKKRVGVRTRMAHIIMELFGCQTPLEDARFIKRVLQKAVREANLTQLHQYFYTFDPPGVTGVIVLKESHIAIHTWPKHGYAAVDLFSCGDRKRALKACEVVLEDLRPKRIRTREIRRGPGG
jgi:S-adenosylmethionine decarboxylase